MSMGNRGQLAAFLALVTAILILGLAPVFAAGILGKSLPDSLIAVSDKTVTGLVGVLGSLCTLIFRNNSTDDKKAENTGKAFSAIEAAAKSGTVDGSAIHTGETVTLAKSEDARDAGL